MSMSRVFVLAIAVLALALAPLACGGGDDSSGKGRAAKARDGKGAAVTAKAGKPGKAAKPGKPGKARKARKNAPGDKRVQLKQGGLELTDQLPENFPDDVPLYPKSSATASLLSGGDEMVVSFSTDDSPADVFSYYKTALGNRGWSVESEAQMDLHSVLITTKDQRTATVLTMAGPTGTQITVTIAQE